MTYFEGDDFENACEEVFIQNGFANVATSDEDPFKDFPHDKEWIKTDLFDHMEILDAYDDHTYYIKNPCGKHRHPDFLLLIYGRVVPVECKSSTERRFRFNGTLPHPTTIYAFSDAVYNMTRVAMGRDLISGTTSALIEEDLRKEVTKLNKKLRKKALTFPGNPYEFGGYVAARFDQRGGQANTDFVAMSDENGWNTGVLVHLQRELRMSKYSSLKRKQA